MGYKISIPDVRLRGLVTRFLSRRPGFVSRPVYVGFMAGKVPLEQIFSEDFCFLLFVSFRQCSVLIFHSSTAEAIPLL
jgi:hypothetical protein